MNDLLVAKKLNIGEKQPLNQQTNTNKPKQTNEMKNSF